MITDTNPTSNAFTSIPFLRKFTGPGISAMLEHKAPKDNNIPSSNFPKKFNIKAGTKMPTVMRSPSEKKRPLKKLLYVF